MAKNIRPNPEKDLFRKRVQVPEKKVRRPHGWTPVDNDESGDDPKTSWFYDQMSDSTAAVMMAAGEAQMEWDPQSDVGSPMLPDHNSLADCVQWMNSCDVFGFAKIRLREPIMSKLKSQGRNFCIAVFADIRLVHTDDK